MLQEGTETTFIAKVTNLSAVDIERLRTPLTNNDWKVNVGENDLGKMRLWPLKR